MKGTGKEWPVMSVLGRNDGKVTLLLLVAPAHIYILMLLLPRPDRPFQFLVIL